MNKRAHDQTHHIFSFFNMDTSISSYRRTSHHKRRKTDSETPPRYAPNPVHHPYRRAEPGSLRDFWEAIDPRWYFGDAFKHALRMGLFIVFIVLLSLNMMWFTEFLRLGPSGIDPADWRDRDYEGLEWWLFVLSEIKWSMLAGRNFWLVWLVWDFGAVGTWKGLMALM